MKYFVAAALAACILIPGSASAAHTAPNLIAATKAYRIENRLPTLQANPQLTKAAQTAAQAMAATGHWSHANAWKWLGTSGYRYTYAARTSLEDS